jgi:hypothetical protein
MALTAVTMKIRAGCDVVYRFYLHGRKLSHGSNHHEGRAIAQAVSRRLPTSAAWVRSQVRSCGVCGGQSGTRAGFPRVLRFPLIPPTAPQSSSSIIRGWYNRPTVADVPSGLSLTPPRGGGGGEPNKAQPDVQRRPYEEYSLLLCHAV